MKPISKFLILVLCIGIFATGLQLGERIARVPDRSAQVIDIDRAPMPAQWANPRNWPLTFAAYRPQSDVVPVQPTPPPAPVAPLPKALTLGATIIALAALVTTLLQGVKSIFPAIGGVGAQIIAVLLAIAGAITAAPAGQPPLVTAGSALTVALSAMGVHGLFKTSSGTPAAATKS